MNLEKSELLVEKNCQKIESLDSSFAFLISQLSIDFEPSTSGVTSLRDCTVSVGNQHQHVSKTSGLSEDVLFSYVFYHEMGHQILPWLRIPEEQRLSFMKDYYSQEKDLRGSPEYFLEINQISLFHNLKLKEFSDQLIDGFDYNSLESNILLSNFSRKLEAIYHEQFAESFSLFMVQKQFPKEFDKLAQFVSEGRKNDEYFYRDIHDEHMEFNKDIGFVHCLHNLTIDYLKNSNSIQKLSDFETIVFPLIDKHTALEMKSSMDSQKLGVYFPKDLISQESIKDKIKSIRVQSLDDSNHLKPKL